MNNTSKDHNDSVPSSRKSIKSLAGYAGFAALAACLILLWRGQTRTKVETAALMEQNNKLLSELVAAKSELKTAHNELDFFKTGDFTKSVRDKTAKPVPPVIAAPVEEPETLFLQEPTVEQSAAGLVARFQFQPDTDVQLPERVTLVARIPGGSPARIVSLNPVSASHSIVEHVLNASGKLAMIEGAPADLEGLVFELTVSEPVKVTVRGSAGIKDFEMDITPDGCTVRKF